MEARSSKRRLNITHPSNSQQAEARPPKIMGMINKEGQKMQILSKTLNNQHHYLNEDYISNGIPSKPVLEVQKNSAYYDSNLKKTQIFRNQPSTSATNFVSNIPGNFKYSISSTFCIS